MIFILLLSPPPPPGKFQPFQHPYECYFHFTILNLSQLLFTLKLVCNKLTFFHKVILLVSCTNNYILPSYSSFLSVLPTWMMNIFPSLKTCLAAHTLWQLSDALCLLLLKLLEFSLMTKVMKMVGDEVAVKAGAMSQSLTQDCLGAHSLLP